MFRRFRPVVCYIARNYSTIISHPAESTSNLKAGTEVAWKSISLLRDSYDSKSCCQTPHTAEHAALEETVTEQQIRPALLFIFQFCCACCDTLRDGRVIAR